MSEQPEPRFESILEEVANNEPQGFTLNILGEGKVRFIREAKLQALLEWVEAEADQHERVSNVVRPEVKATLKASASAYRDVAAWIKEAMK